jgi:hypothetical protein
MDELFGAALQLRRLVTEVARLPAPHRSSVQACVERLQCVLAALEASARVAESRLAEVDAMQQALRESEERYRRLLAQVRALSGDDALVVDSSKSLPALQFMLESREGLGLRREELGVVLALKDARSFAASVLGKRDAGHSLLTVARAFRWWRGANRDFLAALERSGVPYFTSPYEELCFAPEEQCARIASRLGIPLPEAPPTGAPEGHIAIGNKDYLNHTRGTVRYDDRWFHDDRIQLVYFLMPGIRRFNRELHLRCAESAQGVDTSS